MDKSRFVCIHGHFYQPPRESPWLENVEIEDDAFPYHDWNERITAECYAPNWRSRILDAKGRIIAIVNNYAHISFDVGPTLLHWMQSCAPHVLEGIMEGDRLSRERCGGHGNATAQPYIHLIMPLAGPRDKETQVKWGIAEFRARFGRQPEGMWLPETAVDVATLEALAAEGIRFTILSPLQAKRYRPLGGDDWMEPEGDIDPSHPYLCHLPSGRDIAIFFYNGTISHAVAFKRLLASGEAFYKRLVGAFSGGADEPELMHIATDGESYGHHHAHGDMALADALDRLLKTPTVKLTNYGEFLELFPPRWEVEIQENSSWSCAHGVERWRADCGCKAEHEDWQQKWREPLREALDNLKEKLDSLFEAKGQALLRDPWAARNAYIGVILDRSPEAVDRFFGEHGKEHPSRQAKVRALKLLEMQRHGMLMFTSCGWFFDDIGGWEGRQVLGFAARAIQLARDFGHDPEEELLRTLETAPSNVAEYGDGRRVWEERVRPHIADLRRVLAHYAVSSIYREPVERDRVYCFDITCREVQVVSRDVSHLAVGRLEASSTITWEQEEMTFAVIHFGGLDFQCAMRTTEAYEAYEEMKGRLLRIYHEGSLGDVYDLVRQEFEGVPYRLRDMFTEEQRRLVRIVLKELIEDYDETFTRLAQQNEGVLDLLGELSFPIPEQMRGAASVFADRELVEAIANLGEPEAPERIRMLNERGRKWGYKADKKRLERLLASELERELQELALNVANGPDLAKAKRVLEAAQVLDVPLNLWSAQNLLLDLCSRVSHPPAPIREELEAFAEELHLNRSILQWAKRKGG